MGKWTVERWKRWYAAVLAVWEERALTAREASESTRGERFLHFWVLVGRSFVRNRCPVRASSLAYFSLLAMVPMLAVVIGVSSSLLKKSEEPVNQFVTRLVESLTPDARADAMGLRRWGPSPVEGDAPTTAEAAAKAELVESTREAIKERLHEFIGNTRSTAMSATGVVALLAVALFMLARIEETFNDIWGVTRGRSWFNRVMQYWAALSLGPILWATAMALTGGPYVLKAQQFLTGLGPLAEWAVTFGLGLLPYVILSVALGAFYMLMPNTRVDWRAAAVGGVVAGTLWQLNQEFSFFYVSRVVSNSRIYGSLSAVPVFMIGLYISWIILLFGAQVAYAYQNRRSYLEERQVELVNQRSREFVALRLLTRLAQRFQQGQPPPSLTRLAADLGVPSRLANQVLGALAHAGLVTEVAGGDGAYLPARPLSRITADDILSALRAGAGRDLATRTDDTRERLRAAFERIAQAERQVAGQITLQALAEAEAPPAAARSQAGAPPGAVSGAAGPNPGPE